MKHKLTALLLAGLLAVLTGCSLAQPEAGRENEDRFAGFFVEFDASYIDVAGSTVKNSFYRNPSLTERGAEEWSTEYGKISIPKNVLIAEEKNGQYIFPNMEGRSLFLIRGEDPQVFTAAVSDMADNQSHFTAKDGETVSSISGTIYFGPPLDAGPDWDRHNSQGVVHFYRVYESPEGEIYLDGSGNSSSGLGTYTETHTSSLASNGKTDFSETLEVTVNIQYSPRLESLIVSQFDENNMLLCAEDLALRDDLPEVECRAETAWVLVEERSAEGTVRTVYSDPGADGEPAVHPVVLLDGNGWGRTADLNIRFRR